MAMTSTIYTRSGDKGTTGLADGTRVPKHSLRLEAYGTIDEANANLGLALALLQEQLAEADGSEHRYSSLLQPVVKLQAVLTYVSHRLFNCSAILARGQAKAPDDLKVTQLDVQNLENAIDFFQGVTGPLTGFVLCAGVPVGAQLHIARTVIRRAERAICRLYENEPGDELVLMFVNRASDLFFAAARFANFSLGETDIHWQKNISFPDL